MRDDSVVTVDDKIYSLSYGSSLFAGSWYDPTACAYYYIRKEINDGFILFIPAGKVKESPFFIPSTNAICQIFGTGESFHGRSKASKDLDHRKIEGIKWIGHDVRGKHLSSNLSQEELKRRFNEAMEQAILLK